MIDWLMDTKSKHGKKSANGFFLHGIVHDVVLYELLADEDGWVALYDWTGRHVKYFRSGTDRQFALATTKAKKFAEEHFAEELGKRLMGADLNAS